MGKILIKRKRWPQGRQQTGVGPPPGSSGHLLPQLCCSTHVLRSPSSWGLMASVTLSLQLPLSRSGPRPLQELCPMGRARGLAGTDTGDPGASPTGSGWPLTVSMPRLQTPHNYPPLRTQSGRKKALPGPSKSPGALLGRAGSRAAGWRWRARTVPKQGQKCLHGNSIPPASQVLAGNLVSSPTRGSTCCLLSVTRQPVPSLHILVIVTPTRCWDRQRSLTQLPGQPGQSGRLDVAKVPRRYPRKKTRLSEKQKLLWV